MGGAAGTLTLWAEHASRLSSRRIHVYTADTVSRAGGSPMSFQSSVFLIQIQQPCNIGGMLVLAWDEEMATEMYWLVSQCHTAGTQPKPVTS
jgi:hypothetical protein